ncbi:MATE family efflux transporter [Anoxynatronum buryatiense]|uniref:Efflux protein, MATE family n=1 Tax=Anoxynatronum buryatiense TaxID=489973 RepID=A0AA45WXW2_9CLOT|nr:MATE family efflux transporter [Anoxynatronum buryatiense]SMP65609.1 putative efflux protein, MATE family [Anoxynatronum buryatiense]
MKSGDMTEGVIWKKILFFALPLLGTSFIQQLYNTVDLIFVGNVLGKEATAAVGASTLFVTCLVGFFSGLSIGSGVVTSMAFGGGDQKELKKVVHSGMGIGFLCGGLIMVIGYIFAPSFVEWINTPHEIRIIAITYMRVYFISSVSMITFNMGASIIRAMGNAKMTMYIQLAGGLTNVIMNAFFLLVLKKGVEGVAWATLFSQTVAAVLVLIYLGNCDEAYRFSWRQLGIDSSHFGKIVGIGVPIGLQALLITLSNVVVQYHVNSLGVDALAAFTAYFKVELIVYLPIMAFGQAITTFTSQNMGARAFDRVRQGTLVCLVMGSIVTILLSALVMIFGRQAFGLINRDAGVIDLGINIISITVPFYWIYLIMEVTGGSIRGAGRTLPPMVITLANIGILRIALLYLIMSRVDSVKGIAITYPITWAVTAIFMAGYYLRFFRKGGRF